MRTTEHEVPNYTVFSSLLLLPPSYAQIFLSTVFLITFNLCFSCKISNLYEKTYFNLYIL